ncbi:hypothetical protein Golax_002360 [Gossypium laxum]|uniref:Uncharacterized protein n=1 Tax=Gossypium laxum TaxID=34288 RepID=A0A7J9AR24_9ROSI|nr:hypothetical protein [Gossypium laxum]
MNGPIIMGSGIISDKVTLYRPLLEKVPNKFEGGRILMNWLKDNFVEFLKDPEDQTNEETKLGIFRIVHVISGDVSGHKLEVGIDQWLFISTVVVGLVATTISTSEGDRPIYILVGDKFECIPHPVKSVEKSIDVGCEGAIDSVCDGGNA